MTVVEVEDSREMTSNVEQSEAAEWESAFEWEVKGASVEEVWALTGDFLAVERWAPNLVKSCDLVEGEAQTVGCVRKVVFHPVAPGEPDTFLLERLLSMDFPLAYSFSYTILGGSTMPGFSLTDQFVSTFSLTPSPDRADILVLHWSFVCRPVSALSHQQTSAIAFSLYQPALDALRESLSLPHDSITLLSKAS